MDIDPCRVPGVPDKGGSCPDSKGTEALSCICAGALEIEEITAVSRGGNLFDDWQVPVPVLAAAGLPEPLRLSLAVDAAASRTIGDALFPLAAWNPRMRC